MSLMYKLIQQGRNQECEKIAQDLINCGASLQQVKEVTGLSKQRIRKIKNESQAIQLTK